MATMDMRNRAKAIIVEIIRQNGGVLTNKTNLFKAFWKSHVASAAAGRRPLSVYPIARMPQGPGIDDFDRLLGELLTETAIATETVMVGSFQAFEFTLLDENAYSDQLSSDDKLSISEGVQYAAGKTATEVSERSHVDSRSWQTTSSGREIDPDLDSMTDDEFRKLSNKSKSIGNLIAAISQTID